MRQRAAICRALLCEPEILLMDGLLTAANGNVEAGRKLVKQAFAKDPYLQHAFAEMGLPCFEPYGAFYVFPCIKEFGMTSEEFATRFLEEEKVAAVPGTAFGDSGEGYHRISYAYSLEKLKTAIGRLGHFVEKLRAEQNNK